MNLKELKNDLNLRLQLASVSNSKKLLDNISKDIAATRKDSNLTDKGKQEKLRQLDNDLKILLGFWQEEMESIRKKDQEELEALKPKEVAKVPTPEEIATLDYLGKKLLSRLTAEGNSKGGFTVVIKEVVEGEDDKLRQAFIDNYYDIEKLSQRHSLGNSAPVDPDYFEEGKQGTNIQASAPASLEEDTLGLRDFYHAAVKKKKEKLPGYEAYEKEKVKRFSERHHNEAILMAAEKTVTNMRTDISLDVHGESWAREEETSKYFNK